MLSLTNDTHKYSVVNCILYAVDLTNPHQNVIRDHTIHRIVVDVIHNLCSCVQPGAVGASRRVKTGVTVSGLKVKSEVVPVLN
jgi:hypothetical protein